MDGDQLRLVLTLAMGAAATDGVVRLWSRIHPHSYFGVTDVIRGFGPSVTGRTVIARLAIPFVVGALVGASNPEGPAVAGAAATGFGAALVIWPPLVAPELLPDWTVSRRLEIRVAFLLFIGAFAALGGLGGALADVTLALVGPRLPESLASWLRATEVPTLGEIIGGVLGAALFSVGGAALLRVSRLLAREPSDDE